MENISIILCKVQSVRENRFVDLVPLFKPNGVALPVLRNVPVGLFGDNKNHFDWNISIGSIVPCFITTFDISAYISQGNTEKMDTIRRNNLNSAFVLPFNIPSAKDKLAFPEGLRLIGNRLEKGDIDQTGDITRKGNTQITGNLTVSEKIKAKVAEIIQGIKSATANIGGIEFKTHKHKDAEGRYTGGAE